MTVAHTLRMMPTLKHMMLRSLDKGIAKPSCAMVTILLLSCATRLMILLLYLVNGGTLYIGEADRIARSLVLTGAFANPFAIPTGPTAHCAPFYPAVGAIIYCVFGLGFTGEVARCIVSILACSFVFSMFPWLAARFGLDARAGLIAGIVAALLPIRRSTEILGAWETPYAAITLALLLVWTLRLWRNRRTGAWTACLWGMAWGGATLVQTSLAAVFVALCASFVALRWRQSALRAVIVAFLGCAVTLTPWSVRNRVELGGWILVRSNLGIELEMGNHNGASPDVEENIGASRIHPSDNLERARELRRIGELEYNRHALRRAVTWIRGNLSTFFRLCGERCFRFWFSTPLHRREFVLTTILMIIGITGLLRLRETNLDVFVLWTLTLLSFSAIYYVTQYSARYRAVVDWMWFIAAGQLCLDWISFAGHRKKAAQMASDNHPLSDQATGLDRA